MNHTKNRLMKADSLANGSYFFSKNNMNFFNSKIEAGMYKNNTFVTSEDNCYRTRKLFSVHRYNWETHEVITISKFQQFDNLDEAIKFAKSYKGEQIIWQM